MKLAYNLQNFVLLTHLLEGTVHILWKNLLNAHYKSSLDL